MAETGDARPAPDAGTLLAALPTREDKLRRIQELQKKLSKWEAEDEENDPELIRGHIAFRRGFRIGCGAFWLCGAAMAGRVVYEGVRSGRSGRGWTIAILVALVLAGLVSIARGLLYRPDPKMIFAAYEPHRNKPEYRATIAELELLGRALAQDVGAEDAGSLT